MPSGFTGVPTVDIPRSTFNRTHGYKTTFNAGYLIPFYCDEVLPGDTFNLQATLFARLATPLFPIMDNMYLDTQFFFCPSRLVWDDFKSFMGEKDIGDTSTYLVPVLDSATYPATGFLISSIYDYMGLPVLIPTGGGVTAPNYINSLPFRAYNQIYNFWYRDENLQSEITVSTDNGPDAVTDYTVLRRNKKMDYFTGSLPFHKNPLLYPTSAQTSLFTVLEPFLFSVSVNSLKHLPIPTLLSMTLHHLTLLTLIHLKSLLAALPTTISILKPKAQLLLIPTSTLI